MSDRAINAVWATWRPIHSLIGRNGGRRLFTFSANEQPFSDSFWKIGFQAGEVGEAWGKMAAELLEISVLPLGKGGA